MSTYKRNSDLGKALHASANIDEPTLQRLNQRLCQLAEGIASIEQSMAVVCNMLLKHTTIYCGGLAETLGIAKRGEVIEIPSIWEDDILRRVHPDDLANHQLMELKYLHFLEESLADRAKDYVLETSLRIFDNSNNYHIVNHRVFYILTPDNQTIMASFCIFSYCADEKMVSRIVNKNTGETIKVSNEEMAAVLSEREIEVLTLVHQGLLSKQIADCLCISNATVNRHRQNILGKLHVGNAHEACRIAELLGLL